jgi:hypothetical protein
VQDQTEDPQAVVVVVTAVQPLVQIPEVVVVVVMETQHAAAMAQQAL